MKKTFWQTWKRFQFFFQVRRFQDSNNFSFDVDTVLVTQLGGTVFHLILITIAVNLVDCDITEIFLFHFLDISDKHSYLIVTRLVFSSCLSSQGEDKSNATLLWL